MCAHPPTFRELRRAAAPVLLGVFLVATQLAPLAHLATHRAGHTHGRHVGTPAESDHDAAHRNGQAHVHGATGRAPRSRSHANQFVGHAPLPQHDEPAETDHGRESISHFGVALNEGPPPAMVPAPAGTIATLPAAQPRAQRSTPGPQPPTRGPPV